MTLEMSTEMHVGVHMACLFIAVELLPEFKSAD
jgi:hypothetical protein